MESQPVLGIQHRREEPSFVIVLERMAPWEQGSGLSQTGLSNWEPFIHPTIS